MAGWWCPTCEGWVDGAQVTYEEYHDRCGTYLGNCQPSPDQQPGDGELEERVGILRESLSAVGWLSRMQTVDDLLAALRRAREDLGLRAWDVENRIEECKRLEAGWDEARSCLATAIRERDSLKEKFEHLEHSTEEGIAFSMYQKQKAANTKLRGELATTESSLRDAEANLDEWQAANVKLREERDRLAAEVERLKAQRLELAECLRKGPIWESDVRSQWGDRVQAALKNVPLSVDDMAVVQATPKAGAREEE